MRVITNTKCASHGQAPAFNHNYSVNFYISKTLT